MKYSTVSKFSLLIILLPGAYCVSMAQTGAPAAPQSNAGIATPATATVDPMLVGKQALQHEQWGDAQKFFANYLRDNPENVEAQFDLGNAEFGLKQYDEAARYFQAIIAKNPTMWPAHKSMVQIYAAQGKWDEFDRERALIRQARASGAPGLSAKDADAIEVIYTGSERYIVREYAEPAGKFKARYNFTHFDKNGILDSWISCESDDIDQIEFAKKHPAEAAAGKRSYSLDSYSAIRTLPNGQRTQTHGTIKFYPDGEPTYQTVRADVLNVIERKVGPMSTSTGSTGSATQQTAAPQK